jgi:hypothetical protein
MSKESGLCRFEKCEYETVQRSVAKTLILVWIVEKNGRNIVLDFNKSKSWKWTCNVRNGPRGGGGVGRDWAQYQNRIQAIAAESTEMLKKQNFIVYCD